jgi:hypothetical protein
MKPFMICSKRFNCLANRREEFLVKSRAALFREMVATLTEQYREREGHHG